MTGAVFNITERKRAEEERGKSLHRQQGVSLLLQSLLAPASLEDKLKAITDGVVQLFNADFCRIWLIRPGDVCERDCMHAEVHEGPHVCRHRDRCLHLLASSGRYTHTDGKGHRRVPFGCYKIGRIASDQEHKFLTNDVVNDPRVHNHEWARELGLVSFAGYQLRVSGAETMGVLALFAKHPISAEEDSLLEGLGSTVAFVVQQAAAEEAIRQARTEAEQANAAKSQFLANMSHEIRTPMTAILGFAELIGHSIEGCTTCPDHQTCPTRAQNKESIRIIRRNGEHLLDLINDILDLSKIEAGKMPVERIACSPVQVVEEVVSFMRVRAIEKGLSLDARFEFPLPETILSDPVRVRQVLINLVGNAVKFTSEGHVEIVVRCMTGVHAGRASMAFDVKDTGIGMTPDEIGRLFQPFAQADSSMMRQHGGTGLGLAISKRLAEALGGDIHIVSRPGEGSTFTFTVEAELPGPVRMLNDLSEAAARASHQPQLPPPAAVRLCGRVLLAEDGPDNQKLIALILRHAGADVDLASSGRAAVERALEGMAAGTPYDAILMDMQMPEMDGYEATSKLRESGYRGPIVALTAHAMAGDRQKCIDAGCDDYATKPVDRLGLLRMLARLMGCPPSAPGEPASATTAPDEAIASAFRNDPDMAGVIAEFVGQLPERLAQMRQAAGAGLWDVLRRLAHQMKGAGGSYGYACLTEAARELESHANQADAEGAVLALNHLARLGERIQAGLAPDSVSQDAKTR
jgi:signal transduction histidine kinase/DNA-binding NarL/FixJ family response regulator